MVLLLCAPLGRAQEWQSLFDGQSLSGWKASDSEGSFKVLDGTIECNGPRSHLFYVGPDGSAEFKNFEFSAEVLAKNGANSGIYFHTEFQAKGFPDKGFEAQVLKDLGLPHAVGLNHRLAHFQHLFSGDSYAAGYYVYMWAEVLDADAFGAFEEAGNPFDAQVAARLKQWIYSSGNSVEPGHAFASFRGRPPRVEALLEKRGLLQPA